MNLSSINFCQYSRSVAFSMGFGAFFQNYFESFWKTSINFKKVLKIWESLLLHPNPTRFENIFYCKKIYIYYLRLTTQLKIVYYLRLTTQLIISLKAKRDLDPLITLTKYN